MISCRPLLFPFLFQQKSISHNSTKSCRFKHYDHFSPAVHPTCQAVVGSRVIQLFDLKTSCMHRRGYKLYQSPNRCSGRHPVMSALFKWAHIGSIHSARVGGKPWHCMPNVLMIQCWWLSGRSNNKLELPLVVRTCQLLSGCCVFLWIVSHIACVWHEDRHVT